MGTTIATIVTEAQEIIGEVAGASVQTYDDDQMAKIVVRAFNYLFKKFFWPDYSEWVTGTTDGVNGYLTDTSVLEELASPEDIKYVKFNGKQEDVPRLPKHRNPNTVTGSSLVYWSWLRQSTVVGQTNKIKFWPIAAVASVDIYARFYPSAIATQADKEAELFLDKDMLVYGTAFLALSANDLNPQAAEINRNLMEGRFNDIIATLSVSDITLEGRYDVPTEWSEEYW